MPSWIRIIILNYFEALWLFSKLHNCVAPRDVWLEIARGIYAFVTAAGTVAGGHWPLLLDSNGNVKKGFESLYVDGFAIYGLTEFYRATGDTLALELALQTFRAAQASLHSQEPPPAWPYPIPAGRTPHGLSMIFSLAYQWKKKGSLSFYL